MRVLIAGMDGYLGWALAQYLTARGHEVGGVDAFFRRQWVAEMGSISATPISEMPTRLLAFRERWGEAPYFRQGDLTNWDFVKAVFEEFHPDAIVHFGECPSAPYSMVDVHHATWVQSNNIVGTLNILFAMRDIAPQAHLVKLGTMGEYGTPDVDIPEGFFEVEYRGRKDTLPFPRQAGSWYHWSKVHGSNNIMFACRIWGLRSTDIMQGVVYGTQIDEMRGDERLLSRLDFDQSFGTAINRFCCQAVIGDPITPFGKGHQRRGFLPLRDSMQCLTLALENPPKRPEYRVFNQFEETYDVTELAQKVVKVAAELGLPAKIVNLENPRKELEEHYYKPDHDHLLRLGYKPTHDMEGELRLMLGDLNRFRDRIDPFRSVLVPDIRWDGTRRKSRFLATV
jgi:UDP-sulfoquinovose synthase